MFYWSEAGGPAPPRTAHILLLGVRMEGGPDLDPGFLRPFVRPFVRSDFGGRVWRYVFRGNDPFGTILEAKNH